MNKHWNVVATLAVILVLTYAGATVTGLVIGKLTFPEFRESMSVVLLPVLGYLARMLGEK